MKEIKNMLDFEKAIELVNVPPAPITMKESMYMEGMFKVNLLFEHEDGTTTHHIFKNKYSLPRAIDYEIFSIELKERLKRFITEFDYKIKDTDFGGKRVYNYSSEDGKFHSINYVKMYSLNEGNLHD